MSELYKLFEKIADTYGIGAAVILLIIGVVIYIIYFLSKNFSSIITKHFEKKINDDENKHKKGTNYRKKITRDIRRLLSELAYETCANRALLFEYSNGTSNLVGLPFLYITATCEVVTPNTMPVAQLYQKTNTSLFVEFLEKLDENGYYLIDNMEDIKNTLPVIYNFMNPNGAQSALFYAIYGVEDPIGFLVVTTTTDQKFCKKEAIARIAEAAQKVGAMLNFDNIYEGSNNR